MNATQLCTKYGVEGWAKLVTDHIEIPGVELVVITYNREFQFDHEAARRISGKPIVVLDWVEYGATESWRNERVFGFVGGFEPNGGPRYGQLPAWEEYAALDSWIEEQSVFAYFKRELSEGCVDTVDGICSFPVFPLELIPEQPELETFNLDQWMQRFGVFHVYGHSHEDRKRLHAALQVAWCRTLNRIEAIPKAFEQGNNFHILEQAEWYARYPRDYFLTCQRGAKISVALPGFGVKCWRSIESAFNAVPAVADLGMRWAYPWTNESAVLLPTKDGTLDVSASVRILEGTLANPEALFPRLAAAQETARKYHPRTYAKDYIEKTVNELL